MRVVDTDERAVRLRDLVYDRGQGGDEVEVELALEPLLRDLHVQHTQEAAAEAEAEGDGALRLEGEGGVVELELFEGLAQVGVLAAVLGVYAAVDHGPRGAVAGQGLGRGAGGLGDRVADAGVLDVLDARGEVPDVAGGELSAGLEARGAHMADLDDLVARAGGHELYLHVRPYAPVEEAHEDDDAAEGVVLAVEDQGLERGVRVALGRGDAVHYLLEHGGDVDACLAEISGASMAGMPMMSSISVFVRAGSAAGRSILLTTGRISRSWFIAR